MVNAYNFTQTKQRLLDFQFSSSLSFTDESNASNKNVYHNPETVHTDEMNSSWTTVETTQHQSTDLDSSNVFIDVCEIENYSSISISSSENKGETTNEASSTSTKILDPNKDIDIKTEPKKNTRKRKVTPVESHEPKSTEKKNSEKVGPVKRQRKTKCDSDAITDEIQSVPTKPKRSRATKSKAKSIKTEQVSLPQLIDDVTGKCDIQNTRKDC